MIYHAEFSDTDMDTLLFNYIKCEMSNDEYKKKFKKVNGEKKYLTEDPEKYRKSHTIVNEVNHIINMNFLLYEMKYKQKKKSFFIKLGDYF
mgnify:CR=1 FL=1